MLKFINDFLNKTTMYKVLVYGLSLLAAQGIILSWLNFLAFDRILIILSLIVLLLTCYIANEIISHLMAVPTNLESALITGLILFLIIQPASSLIDLFALFLFAVIAMASKYLLVINRMHIFNPAASAALVGALILGYPASWWVGSMSMLPLVAIVGILVVKKVKRFELIGSFLAASIVTIFIFSLGKDTNYLQFGSQLLSSWPIIFFATIMLTEPLTMPGTMLYQILYAIFIGILFGSQFNFGPIYSTPELALVLGNLIFFIMRPRQKFILTIKEKKKLSPEIEEFVFTPNKKLHFMPGQYIEWTFAHAKADSRGNRRYFTIASSPTEDDVIITIRLANQNGSSFKHALENAKVGSQITAAQIAGDFVLDLKKPSVFIAGGIGVTPFRSMVKYLLDNNIKHGVTLFFFAKKPEDFVFKDVFDAAQEKLGVNIHYIVSDPNTDFASLLKEKVTNHVDKKYYLSGPSAMVDNYKSVITKLGVKPKMIVTDYFPGF